MIIKNGHIIDPASQMDKVMDILIENNHIIKCETNMDITDYAEKHEVIDAKGYWVIPGAIDLHVHLREPGFEYKETIHTGTLSAAKGGVTTVCAMPNTNPVIDCKDMVDYVYEKARNEGLVNVLQIGAITQGQGGKKLADIQGMHESGVCGISEDGRSVMNSKLLKEAMIIAKKLQIPVLSHCEDEALAGGAMNAGKRSEELGLEGIPNEAEDIITARDIQLAESVGTHLHLCHVSTKNSVDLIRIAQAKGIDISAEVCPHHFTLTDEDVDGMNTNTKMNPPLRSKEDVDAIKQALKDGVINVIATDHAPHHRDEKNKPYAQAPNGIIGLETMIPLGITELVNKGWLTPMEFIEKITMNPAKVLNINKGTLAIGSLADITIIDPNARYTIEEDAIASKSKNTPFIGKQVNGRIKYTIVNGKIVYKD
jgi:dihydroorotase